MARPIHFLLILQVFFTACSPREKSESIASTVKYNEASLYPEDENGIITERREWAYRGDLFYFTGNSRFDANNGELMEVTPAAGERVWIQFENLLVGIQPGLVIKKTTPRKEDPGSDDIFLEAYEIMDIDSMGVTHSRFIRYGDKYLVEHDAIFTEKADSRLGKILSELHNDYPAG